MPLRIVVATVPDREYPVAEIWQGDLMLAECSREHRVIRLELYPNPRGGPWLLEPTEFQIILSSAVEALGPPRP